MSKSVTKNGEIRIKIMIFRGEVWSPMSFKLFIWLVVWNMALIFPFCWGMSSSQLTFTPFFRGVGGSTTNQSWFSKGEIHRVFEPFLSHLSWMSQERTSSSKRDCTALRRAIWRTWQRPGRPTWPWAISASWKWRWVRTSRLAYPKKVDFHGWDIKYWRPPLWRPPL